MKKYTIEVSKNQLELINQALASFVSLNTGQLQYAIEGLAFNHEAVKQLNQKQKDVLELINSSFDYNRMINRSKDADILYDLHQVMRNQLWKEHYDKSDITVDSSVTKLGGEELAILKIKQ